MGLDMSLSTVPKIEGLGFGDIMRFRLQMLNEGTIDPKIADHVHKVGKAEIFQWDDISDEVGYWRKANQIHRWFVENVQNGQDECDPYEVTREHLQELLELCEQVKSKPASAPELLPTTAGFFFGSTDYDDWYTEDINLTIKILKDALENVDFEKNHLYYCSSW